MVSHLPNCVFIGNSSANGNNFLGLSRLDEREESIDTKDYADDIDIESVDEVIPELFAVFAVIRNELNEEWNIPA